MPFPTAAAQACLPTNRARWFPFLNGLPSCCSHVFFDGGCSDGCEGASPGVLTPVSRVSRDTEHLFRYKLAIHLSLEKMSPSLLCPLLNPLIG